MWLAIRSLGEGQYGYTTTPYLKYENLFERMFQKSEIRKLFDFLFFSRAEVDHQETDGKPLFRKSG
jgi:hypothetical protein